MQEILILSQTQKRLQTLIRNYGFIDEKPAMVRHFTNNRTATSTELYEHEAKALIAHILAKTDEKANTMRRKIIGLLCESKIPGQNFKLENGKPNMQAVYTFIIKKGFLKRSLKSYTVKELPRLVSQIQEITKSYAH